MEGNEECFVRVFSPYTANNPDELSANEGDIVKVIRQVNEHWYSGEINGHRGLFPVIYGTRIEDPLQSEVFTAVETYTGVGPLELGFHAGEQVNVIEEVDHNWWRGEVNGKIGIFPSIYVEKLYETICSKGDTTNTLYQNIDCNKEVVSVEALYGFEARNHEELGFHQGAIIFITKDVDDDWYEGDFEGKTGLFPKIYVQPLSQDIYEKPSRACARSIYPFVGESESELTFKEGELIFLRKRAGSQWLEGEIDDKVGLFPASFVTIEADLPPEIEASTSKTNGDHSRKTVLPAEKVCWREGLQARALYHFSALHSGDLALDENDIVTVISVVDDNWIEGRLDSGVSGLCPSAYLEPGSRNGHFWSSQSTICSELRAGLMAREVSTEPTSMHSRHKSEPTESQRLVYDHFSSDSVFGSSNDKAGFRPLLKSKPAPRPPTNDQGSADIYKSNGIDRIPSRSFSQGQPTQPRMCTSPPSNKTSLYAIPFKSSTNKFSPVSFNLSKPFPSQQGGSSERNEGPVKRITSSRFGTDGLDGHFEGQSGRSLLDMSVSTRASNLNLVTPLVPLPNINQQRVDASNKLPIVPRRKAPPPPKNPFLVNNDCETRSNSLPRTGRKVQKPQLPADGLSSQNKTFGSSSSVEKVNSVCDKSTSVDLKPLQRSGPSRKKRPPPPPARHNKDRFSNITRSATISSSSQATFKQEISTGANKKNPTKGRPYSVYYVGEDKLDQTKPNKSSSLEDIRWSSSGKVLEKPIEFAQSTDDKDASDDHDDDLGNINVAHIPGVAELNKKIANAEHNRQVEWRACSGMKTILQMLLQDQDKHKEMEGKIARSQQKIAEWQDITEGLKNDKIFLIKSYPKKKRIEDQIESLETDLEKQIRSRENLKVLLGIVEESRCEEVLENLSVCEATIISIQSNIKVQEDLLQSLDQPKSNKSTQKHSAEQRQKVINELINTEKDYLRDLQLCLQYFAEELKHSKVVDSTILFGNMKNIVETSRKLLNDFEQAVREKDTTQQEIGKYFVEMADEIKDVYAQYCRNHDDAIALLEKYEDEPEAQEIFNRCLTTIRDSTKCWDLSSFLIKPVQRVLKYPLLLSELLKYTPEIHKDKQNLIKATSVMTDVATAINEVKRRKDIVLKYKRVEESGITNKFQKLNWHSVLKKSSRLNQRITQLTGLVSQTVDKRFNEEEKKFIALEKAVKNLIKNISGYVEQVQDISIHQRANGTNIQDYYCDAATCTEVTMYRATVTRISDVLLETFLNDVHRLVLSPLNDLLALFQGPQRLIQKRHHKCLDYDSCTNRIEKIKDRDKLKAAKAELQTAKKDYEALNVQLLEELPLFYNRTISLFEDCVLNFAQAKRKYHAVLLGEYTNLMLLPMVKEERDIFDHQTNQTQKVIESFSNLSFIPSQFLGKQGRQKSKKDKKQPLIPSTPASIGDVTSDKSGEKTQQRDRLTSISRKRMAPPPPQRTGIAGATTDREQIVVTPKPIPRKQMDTPLIPRNVNPVEITPNNFEPYVVVCNFEAQNPGELNLNEGELVTVQCKSDTSGNAEWWRVSCAGVAGYIPSSFLEIYTKFNEDNPECSDSDDDDDDDDASDNIEIMESERNDDIETDDKLTYYAQFEFEGTSTAELSLDEGQIVTVLQQHDLEGNPEWWLVETEGKKGYVAANFLAPLEDK